MEAFNPLQEVIMRTCCACNVSKDESEFYPRKKRKTPYTSECKECFKERMGERHQHHKDTLVEEHGGKCRRCGYNKSIRILHFHHLDPTLKDFEIADRLSSNLTFLREECKKCILLCPNCHGELHQGLWDIKELDGGPTET